MHQQDRPFVFSWCNNSSGAPEKPLCFKQLFLKRSNSLHHRHQQQLNYFHVHATYTLLQENKTKALWHVAELERWQITPSLWSHSCLLTGTILMSLQPTTPKKVEACRRGIQQVMLKTISISTTHLVYCICFTHFFIIIICLVLKNNVLI